MDRGSVHSIYRGVRIEYEAHGWQHHYCFDKLFMFLTSVVVIMSIPAKLMSFFLVTCLGRLSTIYARFLNEPIDINHDIGGMIMRLMSHSVSFVELEGDSKGNDRGTNDRVISQSQVAEQLRMLLSKRTE